MHVAPPPPPTAKLTCMTEFYITPESITEHMRNLFALASHHYGHRKKNFSLSRFHFQQRGVFFLSTENKGCVSNQECNRLLADTLVTHRDGVSPLFHANVSATSVTLKKQASCCSYATTELSYLDTRLLSEGHAKGFTAALMHHIYFLVLPCERRNESGRL